MKYSVIFKGGDVIEVRPSDRDKGAVFQYYCLPGTIITASELEFAIPPGNVETEKKHEGS